MRGSVRSVAALLGVALAFGCQTSAPDPLATAVEELIALEPGSPDIGPQGLSLGAELMAARRFREARQVFRWTAEHFERHPPPVELARVRALQGWAVTDALMGHPRRAVSTLEQALALVPAESVGEADLLYELGRIETVLSQRQAAQRFENALETYRRNLDASDPRIDQTRKQLIRLGRLEPVSPRGPAHAGLEPVERRRPVYPREQRLARIEGWVLVDYTVAPDGSVADAVVVDSDPPGPFDRAALLAVKDWVYAPLDAPREHVQTVIEFILEYP